MDIVSFLLGKQSASSGESVTIESLSVTENGTYTAEAGHAYSPVTVNVSGGGGGGSPILAWDLKSSTPLVDTVRGVAAAATNVTFGENGAVFDSASDYMIFPALAYGIKIEVDIGAMTAHGTNDKRLITSGTIYFAYRTTNVWSFYNSTWEDSEITDFDYFAGHTLKVEIDSDKKWHFYRDGVLFFEPSTAGMLSSKTFDGSSKISFLLGSSEKSACDTTLTAVRVY